MSEHFHVPSLIVKKREGQELAKEEIRSLIEGFTRGDVADAQMSAFAMAVYFRGMTAAETAALTYAMLESGERFSALQRQRRSAPIKAYLGHAGSYARS